MSSNEIIDMLPTYTHTHSQRDTDTRIVGKEKKLSRRRNSLNHLPPPPPPPFPWIWSVISVSGNMFHISCISHSYTIRIMHFARYCGSKTVNGFYLCNFQGKWQNYILLLRKVQHAISPYRLSVDNFLTYFFSVRV